MMGGLHRLQPRKKRTSQLLRTQSQCRGGFTIVETMIVLAVTGVLFVSAVAAVSGRQGKTQFNQAINATKGEIEQIIGEVQSGYYANMGNTSCRTGLASEGGDTNLSIGTTQVAQGANDACVFLGKVIHFGGNTTNPQKIGVYTLAGLRDASTFQTSKPTVVGQSTEFKNLQFGLTAVNATSGAIAVVTSFGLSGPQNTAKGTASLNIIPVPGASIGATEAATQASINANVRSQSPTTSDTVVCYRSGTTNQSGRITISSGGTVTLDIRSSENCS